MRRIREILRLCWELGWGQSKTASSLGISSSTVNRMCLRARAAKLSWPLPEDLDDADLERMLFPPPAERPRTRPEPDWSYIHSQLKLKGVTLGLLWQEYKESYPEGYQLSQFCDLYRAWRSKLSVSMRQKHRAGENAFSDFAGAKFRIINPGTGEVTFASLFVSALGASNYTFADAYPDESAESWCTGQADAFEFFQGVTEAVVPDNPKGTVTKPCRSKHKENNNANSTNAGRTKVAQTLWND